MMEIQISQLSDVIIMTYSRIKDFKDSKTWLKAMDLENFFNVYADKNGNFVYNLNNSIYFNVQKGSLDEYTLSHDMHWTLISYMLYGTTRFAWLLMKVNNITAENIFQKKKTGEKILFIPKDELSPIVDSINEER